MTQVNTIVNTKTNKVEIVSIQVVKKESKPSIQVISGPIIKIAQKKYTEIKEIVQNIESSVSASVTFESITVKNLKDVKIYTPIFTTPSVTGRTKMVYVYNKKTKEVKEIEKVTIEKTVKQAYFEKEVTKYHEVVIKSNDVALVTIERPEMTAVLTQIDETYKQKISETIKSVKVTEQKYSTEYQIVTEVQGKTTEVTVIKKGNEIKVLGLEEIVTSIMPLPVTQVTVEETTVIEEETVEVTSET